jgi:hypothetical protein
MNEEDTLIELERFPVMWLSGRLVDVVRSARRGMSDTTIFLSIEERRSPKPKEY